MENSLILRVLKLALGLIALPLGGVEKWNANGAHADRLDGLEKTVVLSCGRKVYAFVKGLILD